ncbi:hypothetical protein [Lacticaseibacillus porcinae]|uniref:hypothetical protein n=1 Tax=Lacticaseibacillus porcinae TaxID=1123687 RepID=UPI000F7B7871|nr:hypothetical protein [Lacticaseibacillus porcinae]
MACYERFDDDYPLALIEQNIFDNRELQSHRPVFCYPLHWDNPAVSALVFEPMALMYQEDEHGQRYYVLYPVSWSTRTHSGYHLVTTDLHHALSFKTVTAKRRAILAIIRVSENRREMDHIINN